MVLLDKVVGVFSREEAGGFPRETSEAWNTEAEEGKRKQPNSGMDAASLGVTPAMKRMAASILESKSRKAGKLVASSETRAR